MCVYTGRLSCVKINTMYTHDRTSKHMTEPVSCFYYNKSTFDFVTLFSFPEDGTQPKCWNINVMTC